MGSSTALRTISATGSRTLTNTVSSPANVHAVRSGVRRISYRSGRTVAGSLYDCVSRVVDPYERVSDIVTPQKKRSAISNQLLARTSRDTRNRLLLANDHQVCLCPLSC